MSDASGASIDPAKGGDAPKSKSRPKSDPAKARAVQAEIRRRRAIGLPRIEEERIVKGLKPGVRPIDIIMDPEFELQCLLVLRRQIISSRSTLEEKTRVVKQLWDLKYATKGTAGVNNAGSSIFDYLDRKIADHAAADSAAGADRPSLEAEGGLEPDGLGDGHEGGPAPVPERLDVGPPLGGLDSESDPDESPVEA